MKKTAKKVVVYVVTAYRWGDTEKHSYVVGAFTTPELAERASEKERSWRGGKYECRIAMCVLDQPKKTAECPMADLREYMP